MAKAPSDRQTAAAPRFGGTASVSNRLLAQLPEVVRERFDRSFQRVSLRLGVSLFHAHEPLRAAYFPESGAISLLAHLIDGETLEVGLIGKDGMAGVALIPGVNVMPYTGTVQIAGTALRIEGEKLRELVQQFEPAHRLFGRYAYTVFAQGVQTAACNNYHSVRQRSARWLLMVHDLVDDRTDSFPLTQNLMALMLGVRRPSVTLVARDLQRAGLVEYRHGRMTVLDRRGLEAASCECYQLMRDEQLRLLGY